MGVYIYISPHIQLNLLGSAYHPPLSNLALYSSSPTILYHPPYPHLSHHPLPPSSFTILYHPPLPPILSHNLLSSITLKSTSLTHLLPPSSITIFSHPSSPTILSHPSLSNPPYPHHSSGNRIRHSSKHYQSCVTVTPTPKI